MAKNLLDCITQEECYERQNTCRATTRTLVYTVCGVVFPVLFALFGYMYLQGMAQAEQNARHDSVIDSNTAKIERIYTTLDRMDEKLDRALAVRPSR